MIWSITVAWVMNARIRIAPWHEGHASGSTSKICWSRAAHRRVASIGFRSGSGTIAGDTGVAARAALRRIGTGHILAIDRSPTAIAQAVAGSARKLASVQFEFRCASVEEFVLGTGERPHDLAFAVRVGALDGQHTAVGRVARRRLQRALVTHGLLFIDEGKSVKQVELGAT